MTECTIDNCRHEFPSCDNWTYLNHAAMSPIPKRCADAMKAVADAIAASGPLELAEATKQITLGRSGAAMLINADRDDVAFVMNTTSAISLVANGIQWRPGDNVVVADIEYPANVYPWMAQERNGVELKWVNARDGRLRVEDYAAAIDDRTQVLSVSSVEFSTGFRNDIAALGEICRERDVLFVVDGIQTLGAFKLDVRECKIDVLAAGGHKWLMGTPGAGLMYCRPEIIERIGAMNAGADSMVKAEPYLEYKFEPRPNARRFESGVGNLVGTVGLAASISLIREVGIENIEPRIEMLTDRVCEGLLAKGYEIYCSREPGRWSGIVVFDCGDRDGDAIVAKLMERKIVISLREGRLRISPHFYNTTDDIDRCLDALP